MRTIDTLFDTFEEIQLLCQYLYMDESHKLLIHNQIGVPLEIFMNENLEIGCRNMNFPDLSPMWWNDATPSKLNDVIGCLEEEKAVEFPERFKNRWEEVKEITRDNLALNRDNYLNLKERERREKEAEKEKQNKEDDERDL